MSILNIEILDCTLRDGGYVNNWTFGSKNITGISEKLSEGNIDIIEGGFLSTGQKTIVDQSIFNSIYDAEKILISKRNNVALMINLGECKENDIVPYVGGIVSILRIAFHYEDVESAKNFCSNIISRGYKIFLQPMVTMYYSDSELFSLASWANSFHLDAFYIVDSFGTMKKDDLMRIYGILDTTLDQEIKIGFHSHNNLQLSFSNALALIKKRGNRDLIIDSSVLGMGRGAGNLCTELISRYINNEIQNRYDLIPILEIMDEYIMPIYNKRPWGYSAPYYLAAINDCHPNYATFLADKSTIGIADINSIIKSIPENKRHLYNESVVQNLYIKYLNHNIDDKLALNQIRLYCNNRKILLLAPGKSQHVVIQNYINNYDPYIFALNHIPTKYKYNKIFVSNLRRFKSIEKISNDIKTKLICTSNVTDDPNVLCLNFAAYLNDDDIISDNAGAVLINILIKAQIKEIAVAGFDGFDYNNSNNYYDDNLINNTRYERSRELNVAMNKFFSKVRNQIIIDFLTPSKYDIIISKK